jgi:acetyl-CoA carboxylase carboxyl transferase subunit alpha
MLQYATYSVISPEGCASILWKDAGKAADAAETLGITAERLKKLGMVDKIIPEPLGGAHRDYQAMMQSVQKALRDTLKQVQAKSEQELLQERFNRLMAYGKYKEVEIK